MLRLIRRFPLITFVLFCLVPVHGILWAALLLGAEQEVLRPLKLPFAFLPTVSAFIISWIIGSEEEVSSLWKRTFNRETPIRLYLFGFLIFVFLGALAIFVRWEWDGYFPPSDQFPAFWMILVVSPFLLLFPGFAEEYGWRGFFQERLNKKMPVFLGSLIVGLTWGTWHGMDFLMGNWPQEPFNVFIFFIYIVGVSVIIGEVYTRAGGNVAIAMIAHFGANIVNFFIPVWKIDAGLETPFIFLGLLWVTSLMILLIRILSWFRSRKTQSGS